MREVLDHEIVDVNGVSCGMVDDIAFEMRRNGVPEVAALIVGPRAWSARTPSLLSWLVRCIVRAPVVRVPWSAVAHVSETIELRVSAESVGLGKRERKVGRWLARIPGA